MKINSQKLLTFLAAAAFAVQSHAILVDNGTFTTDTETGLDWLDMSFTDGLSYNQTAAAISGGSLTGWRFATSSEFDQLINSAVGFAYTAIYSDAAIYTQMVNLVSLLGSTYDSGTNNLYAYTVGFVDSTGLNNAHARQFGFHFPNGYVRPDVSSGWDRDKSYADSNQGSFLVRSSTTTPPSQQPSNVPDSGSTLILLGTALAGFAWIKRRR